MKRKKQNNDNGFEEFGGYMAAKINKLEEQFSLLQQDFKRTNLFQGISIFVNGRTVPTADDLKRIMLENGGTFHHYERNHTTFIIASNLANVKIKSNYTKSNIIIKPEWIVDCLKENRIVDYSNYLLHTNINSKQRQISFKKIEAQTEEQKFAFDLDVINKKLQNTPMTAANKLDEQPRTGTAVDSNFLQEFLNNSRLHCISTMSTGFKFYITDLRKKHNGIFPEREIIKSKFSAQSNFQQFKSVIMHIDMDCFFVSVGLRNIPNLKGKPIAVTHSKGKGESEEFMSMSEIASCSYEARAMGVKNGMFVGNALKLCPDLKTIPYEFEMYREIAFKLYDTVAKYTLDIEAVSCDELYANLTSMLNECKIDLMKFISSLREEILMITGCTCSVGIGTNRLQARMATKQAKPNNQFELLSTDVMEFMKDKKITDLPGVGDSTAFTLAKLQLETCGQIQKIPLQLLQNHLGKKFSENVLMMAKGLDDRPLNYDQVRKSVSVDINYGIRFNDDEEVKGFLKQVCDELSKRLNEIEKKGKCVTLKIMMRAKNASAESKKFLGHGEADKVSKSMQLAMYTSDSQTILKTAQSLMSSLNIPAHDLRGIGIQISKLDGDNDNKTKGKIVEMFQKMSENEKVRVDRVVKIEPSVSKVNQSPKKRKPRGLKKMKSSSNITSVAEMFANKKTSTSKRKFIDVDVLAQLPSDIVEEILRDYELHGSDNEEEEENQATVSKEDIEVVQQESFENNMFLKNNWRSSLKKILEDDLKRDDIVIDLLQLIRVKNLELPFQIMRFLHRNIEDNKKRDWQLFYNEINSRLQDEMRNVYDRKLSVPKEFLITDE